MRVLILGGTSEARALAAALQVTPDHQVVSSLAGRTAGPTRPEGEVRVGGFDGPEGLARYLRTAAIDLLVDATHPFAATMTAHAARAAANTGVRLLVLRRPAWSPGPGDDWRPVPDLPEAARTAADLPEGRVFVTTGRQGVHTFAADHRHPYLIRTVEPPDGPLPPRHVLLLDRGPYTVAGESELMRTHEVTALVTKNSGGTATEAKLAAARDRGIPVIMVDPPAPPAGVTVLDSVEAILRRI